MKNLKNRRGYISIHRDLILEGNQKILSTLFSKFFPLIIRENTIIFDGGLLNYYGISPEFDEIADYEAIPKYECITSITDVDETTQEISVKFERIYD